MSPWHPGWAAHVGLRIGGLILLATLWPQGLMLRRLVRASPLVTPADVALAAIAFLSASLGVALLLLGPDLWKPVALSDRWIHHRPRAR